MPWEYNQETGRLYYAPDAPTQPPAPLPANQRITGGGSGTGTGSGSMGNPWAPGAPGPGGGQPIPVGVQPPKQGGGRVYGPQLPGFNNTGIDFDQIKQILAEQEGKVRDIFGGELGIGTGQFGILGSRLASMLTNPQGFNEKDLQLARTRIAEREAGTRATALSNLGSPLLGRRLADETLRENIRGQSSQRITDAELALDFQNQQMKQQNLLAAIQAALGSAGISAGLTSDLGQIIAGAYNPLPYAGAGGGQEGPGGSMLPNERGLAENRLPGESLADQLRREAAAWQAYYGGASTPTG